MGLLAIVLFELAQRCGAVQCMAKVKFSALISEMRGKLNGSVFSRNRGGAYIRNKVTPLNPQTIFQVGVRSFFTTLTQAWRGLAAAERAAWNSAVANFVGTDIFGDSLTLSGANLHQRLNLNLLNIGEPAITTPPVPAPVIPFATMTLAVSEGGGTVAIAYTDVILATDTVLVFMTPGVSPGREFVKNDYRLIGVMEAADVTPFDIAAAYITKFGAIPAEGQKIFVKVKTIIKLSGLQSGELTAQTLVAA